MKLQNFVFAHEQRIILDMIANKKFDILSNVTYLMLGSNDSDLLIGLPNVVIEKDYSKEEWCLCDYNRNMIAFTGWQVVKYANLIDSDTDYVNLFEYDIKLSPNFEQVLIDEINTNGVQVIGYIPLPITTDDYIKTEKYSKEIVDGIRAEYGIDMHQAIESIIKSTPDPVVSVTSCHTFKASDFRGYMNFMQPLIKYVKDNRMSGHQTERSISFWYIIMGKEFSIIPEILHHYQLDTHQTQGIPQEKFDLSYQYVVKP